MLGQASRRRVCCRFVLACQRLQNGRGFAENRLSCRQGNRFAACLYLRQHKFSGCLSYAGKVELTHFHVAEVGYA